MSQLIYIPILFLACESRGCVTVTIVDDEGVDNTDTVNIALERPEDLDRRISVRNGRGQIVIADDSTDGVCVCACVYMCVKCSVSHCFLQRLWFVLCQVSTQLQRGQMHGVAEVCLEVVSTSDCPINFAFTVRLNTRDGSAG